LRQALGLVEKLAADFPAVPEYPHQLACTCSNLGTLLADAGRHREAEKILRRALALFETLAADQSAYLRHGRAGTYNTLGGVLKTLGRPEEAGQAYRQALALWEGLAGEFPAVPDHASHLGGALHNLARLRNDRGDPEGARALAERAIRHQRRALGRSPGDPAYRRLLRDHYGVLAEALARLGRHAEAVRAAGGMPNVSPDDWQGYHAAAARLARCMRLAARQGTLSPEGRRAALRTYAERARGLLREAVRRGADDPAAQNALAWFLATCPEPSLRDPRQAVLLAERAVRQAPRDGGYRNTLAVARYRAGDWRGAIAALLGP
jgi:tetratricopeptide (TPR) repeat protein